MLAHLLTDGIPFQMDGEFKTYVPVFDLTVNLYNWLNLYMDKIQKDLLALGLWDQLSRMCDAYVYTYCTHLGIRHWEETRVTCASGCSMRVLFSVTCQQRQYQRS